MVREAEQFAAEDEAHRKRIEAQNSLSSFVYGLKTQLGDQEGLGGKLSEEDKKTILSAVKETTDWIDSEGSSASLSELEDKLSGSVFFLFLCLLSLDLTTTVKIEIQAVVNPITSKLYNQGAGSGSGSGGEEPVHSHDEL
jgi:endoplasmic reticulum chaperone BiP